MGMSANLSLLRINHLNSLRLLVKAARILVSPSAIGPRSNSLEVLRSSVAQSGRAAGFTAEDDENLGALGFALSHAGHLAISVTGTAQDACATAVVLDAVATSVPHLINLDALDPGTAKHVVQHCGIVEHIVAACQLQATKLRDLSSAFNPCTVDLIKAICHLCTSLASYILVPAAQYAPCSQSSTALQHPDVFSACCYASQPVIWVLAELGSALLYRAICYLQEQQQEHPLLQHAQPHQSAMPVSINNVVKQLVRMGWKLAHHIRQAQLPAATPAVASTQMPSPPVETKQTAQCNNPCEEQQQQQQAVVQHLQSNVSQWVLQQHDVLLLLVVAAAGVHTQLRCLRQQQASNLDSTVPKTLIPLHSASTSNVLPGPHSASAKCTISACDGPGSAAPSSISSLLASADLQLLQSYILQQVPLCKGHLSDETDILPALNMMADRLDAAAITSATCRSCSSNRCNSSGGHQARKADESRLGSSSDLQPEGWQQHSAACDTLVASWVVQLQVVLLEAHLLCRGLMPTTTPAAAGTTAAAGALPTCMAEQLAALRLLLVGNTSCQVLVKGVQDQLSQAVLKTAAAGQAAALQVLLAAVDPGYRPAVAAAALIPAVAAGQGICTQFLLSGKMVDTNALGKAVSSTSISSTNSSAICYQQDSLDLVTPAAPNWTVLHLACAKGDLQTVEQLIGLHDNINAVDTKGWTPLLLALVNGHSAVVRYLSKAGAELSVAAADVNGSTATSREVASALQHVSALHLAVAIDDCCMLQMLLDHVADHNAPDLLLLAAELGSTAAIRVLLDSCKAMVSTVTVVAATKAAFCAQQQAALGWLVWHIGRHHPDAVRDLFTGDTAVEPAAAILALSAGGFMSDPASAPQHEQPQHCCSLTEHAGAGGRAAKAGKVFELLQNSLLSQSQPEHASLGPCGTQAAAACDVMAISLRAPSSSANVTLGDHGSSKSGFTISVYDNHLYSSAGDTDSTAATPSAAAVSAAGVPVSTETPWTRAPAGLTPDSNSVQGGINLFETRLYNTEPETPSASTTPTGGAAPAISPLSAAAADIKQGSQARRLTADNVDAIVHVTARPSSGSMASSTGRGATPSCHRHLTALEPQACQSVLELLHQLEAVQATAADQQLEILRLTAQLKQMEQELYNTRVLLEVCSSPDSTSSQDAQSVLQKLQ